MNTLIADKLALLPETPGVYKMLDAAGNVIYVGKAVSLKRRVSQYFQKNRDHTPKVLAMVSHIADFETIEVRNETEAFSLESNLIKEFMPKYNILLKDDKHFPYVRINMKTDFPRVEIVRRVQEDGAEYIGPFLSAVELREQLSIIRNEFPIRHCRKDISRAIAARERPCLMHHLHKCCAPCSGSVSREEYHALMRDVISFLNGNISGITAKLRAQMLAASEKEEFERAAFLRDRLFSLEKMQEKQVAIFPRSYSADVFCPASGGGLCLVFALYVRDGKIIGTESYGMQAMEEDPEADILNAFLLQHYRNAPVPPAPEILLPVLPVEPEETESFLRDIAGRKIEIRVPQRGDKVKLIEIARQNGAEQILKKQQLTERAWEREKKAAAELAACIGLESIPMRMECFDNSHIMGTDTVGAMVVFVDGKPFKNGYRRYRLRSQTQGDDLLAMEEALTRRFGNEANYPDLLIVDGGPTQLEAAERVLEAANLSYIPVIALAEQHELIYVPGEPLPLELPKNCAALHLLERIRDEAHRFAIEYHRSLRSKRALLSRLDGISGIGDKRKRALFDAYITVEAMSAATLQELADVPGMNAPAAQAVYAFLHPEQTNGGA